MAEHAVHLARTRIEHKTHIPILKRTRAPVERYRTNRALIMYIYHLSCWPIRSQRLLSTRRALRTHLRRRPYTCLELPGCKHPSSETQQTTCQYTFSPYHRLDHPPRTYTRWILYTCPDLPAQTAYRARTCADTREGHCTSDPNRLDASIR